MKKTTPPSKTYQIRLRPEDEKLLNALEKKMGLQRAQLIKLAIRELANKESV